MVALHFPEEIAIKSDMHSKTHWEHIYETKTPEETSWYQPHLEISTAWIKEAAGDTRASIIDIGAGESTLVDDLLIAGFQSITLLDISEAALAKSRHRLGAAADKVIWLTGDVTRVPLPADTYEIWHDRAVFHFLTEPGDQAAYVRQATASVRRGGSLIMATFGPQGPTKCSELSTARYSVESLKRLMMPSFQLLRSRIVEHQTPAGHTQQFLYSHFRRSE
jgi:SAM-dependent methyltransferase